MSATLEIINNYSIESFGRTYRGHQGDADQDFDEAIEVTVTGDVMEELGTLATASGRTIWDDDDDNPTGFLYFFFCADEDCYLQLIGATSQVSLPIKADAPFVLRDDTILAAANTTPLAAAPTLEDIDSIRIWNESGNEMNFHSAVIN